MAGYVRPNQISLTLFLPLCYIFVIIPVVHNSLRHVFDESYTELDIWAVHEEVKPHDDISQSEDEADDNKQTNAS